jgi:hypothetical protein
MSCAAAVDAACAHLGLGEPWRGLLLRAGPTPLRGPLTHDLLMPGTKRGLNVFPHGRAIGLVETLVDVSTGSADLLRIPGVAWAGGVAFGPDGPRLKLYAVDGLAALRAHIGVDPAEPPGAMAVGVEIGRASCRERVS